MTRDIIVALICFVLIGGTPAARTSMSEKLGPPGGWAISLAVNPASGKVYCAWHGGGILQSADGGKTWEPANTGLTQLTVVTVVVNPINPNMLYAGTESGLFVSTDQGSHWSESSGGLNSKDVWSVAVDSQNQKVVYAGTAGGGIYRSNDAGLSWMSVTPGNRAVITALLVDPVDSDTVYAATLKGGILRSLDAGKSWTSANNGMSAGRTFSLTIDSHHRLYAGTDAGVFMTTNKGTSWTLISSNWAFGKKSPVAVFCLAVSGLGSRTIYAGTDRGILKTSDGGTSWAYANKGAESEIIWSLAANPHRSNELYAGTLGNGILLSSDGAKNWRHAKLEFASQLVYSLLVDPSDSRKLYAGTAGAGVYKSEDKGRTWQQQNAGLEDRVVKVLAIDPSDSQILYAGSERAFLVPGGAVYKSLNGGTTWRQISDTGPRVFSLAIDRKSPSTVYVGMEDGKIMKSVDSGTTWRNLNETALTLGSKTSTVQQAIHQQPVFAIVIDPLNSDTVYAGTDSGVFKTIDAGKNWAPINQGLTDVRVRSLAIDDRNPQVLYLGTGDESKVGSVFKTHDGGRVWLETGLKQRWVLSLFLSSTADTIFAGTDRGVFFSQDAGQSWSSLGGEEQRYILSLALDKSSPMSVYGGTEGESIFRFTNAE